MLHRSAPNLAALGSGCAGLDVEVRHNKFVDIGTTDDASRAPRSAALRFGRGLRPIQSHVISRAREQAL